MIVTAVSFQQDTKMDPSSAPSTPLEMEVPGPRGLLDMPSEILEAITRWLNIIWQDEFEQGESCEDTCCRPGRQEVEEYMESTGGPLPSAKPRWPGLRKNVIAFASCSKYVREVLADTALCGEGTVIWCEGDRQRTLSGLQEVLDRFRHLSITRLDDRHRPPTTFVFADWIDRFPNISRLNIDWSPTTRGPDFIQLETASNHRRPRVVSANQQLSIVDITILDRSEFPTGDHAAGIQELEYILRQIEFPQIKQLCLQIYPRRIFSLRQPDAGLWDSLGQALDGVWCPDLRKFALTLELRHNNFPSAIDLVKRIETLLCNFRPSSTIVSIFVKLFIPESALRATIWEHDMNQNVTLKQELQPSPSALTRLLNACKDKHPQLEEVLLQLDYLPRDAPRSGMPSDNTVTFWRLDPDIAGLTARNAGTVAAPEAKIDDGQSDTTIHRLDDALSTSLTIYHRDIRDAHAAYLSRRQSSSGACASMLGASTEQMRALSAALSVFPTRLGGAHVGL